MKSDQEAEAALPPGVAKGRRLDTTPTEQQLAAGGGRRWASRINGARSC